MKKTRGFLFTASIALATAITISCGSDGGGGGDGGNSSPGGEPSSSSGGGYKYCVADDIDMCYSPRDGICTIDPANDRQSNTCPNGYFDASDIDDGGDNSSSSGGGSDCDISGGTQGGGYAGEYGTLQDSRDNKSYKTVVIGTQTWMAENLNYSTASGSKCYNDNPANCATYGRLYDWETALTACPSGWHLPSDAEWTTLENTVGSSTAGTKLKATSGWCDNGNGTNDYGFSALPGGIGLPSGSFAAIGEGGSWPNSTESSASHAYGRSISSNLANVYRSSGDKSAYDSVRCIKD